MGQVSSIFQYINDEGEVVEYPRFANIKTISNLVDVINKGKDGLTTAEAVAKTMQQEKWDKYKRKLEIYEDVKTAIEEHNAANSDNPEYTPEALPVKPSWSDDDIAYITTDYVLGLPEVLEAKKNATKNKGVVINDILASLTKSDQNGLCDVGVIVLVKTLVQQGIITVDGDVEVMIDSLDQSINFHFQNKVQAPINLDINDYCRFAIPFLGYRQTVL